MNWVLKSEKEADEKRERSGTSSGGNCTGKDVASGSAVQWSWNRKEGRGRRSGEGAGRETAGGPAQSGELRGRKCE